ncbi:MAG: UDP-N-acetylmuramate dehydrogenase [Actinomycetota bacterium]|nr:UDP-N-acetylmuramate dehydrogenase [Actinomycetota bacterium]
MTSSAGVPTVFAVPLAEHTTLRLGGPAGRLVFAETPETLVNAVQSGDADAIAAGESPPLVLGGGSNVLVCDAGVPGTTVLVATKGRAVAPRAGGARLTVEAGEDWDSVVTATVAEGWSGLECLSGIPGRVGAVPVQNVGAYGVEIAELLVDVDLYDRRAGRVRMHVPAAELGLGYRTSALKGRDEAVVLRVRLDVAAGPFSGPLRNPELARALDVPVGARAPIAEVREAVLALRRSKGMVLDTCDHDTWSAGSFFTNPVLDAATADRVAAVAGVGVADMPRWPTENGLVKLSAAWLISHAGFERGHPGPGGRVGLSGRHSLALTNRGGGTAADLLGLAREVRDGVWARFGVRLTAEPVLVGCTL